MIRSTFIIFLFHSAGLIKVIDSTSIFSNLPGSDLLSGISTLEVNTPESSCSESSENQLGYCNGTIIPVNSLLAAVSSENAPLVNPTVNSDAALGLCQFVKLFMSGTPISKQNDNPMNMPTCGFMQKRGFCQSQKLCDLSFIVFVQAKINGSFVTICSGFVSNKSEVITSPACYSSVNGSDLYVFFSNKQRIKVKCIKDAPLYLCSTSNSANVQTAVYVHKLKLCDESPVPAANISNNNKDLTPVMITPNSLCNNVSSTDFDLIFTDVILLSDIAGILVFVPSGTAWAKCTLFSNKIVSNEGSVLVNNKCEVLGFLRAPSKALLDALYSVPIAPEILINPKCELLGNNIKNLLPCN